MLLIGLMGGGQSGIRTHGELPPTAVFKTAAFNHSAICPLPGRVGKSAAGGMSVAVDWLGAKGEF